MTGHRRSRRRVSAHRRRARSCPFPATCGGSSDRREWSFAGAFAGLYFRFGALLLGARLRLTPPEVFAQGGSQPVVLLRDGFRGGGHGKRIHDLTDALRTPDDKFTDLP